MLSRKSLGTLHEGRVSVDDVLAEVTTRDRAPRPLDRFGLQSGDRPPSTWRVIMATVEEQVCAQLGDRLDAAEAVVAADRGASPVRAGVFAEFRRKFAKIRPALEGDS